MKKEKNGNITESTGVASVGNLVRLAEIEIVGSMQNSLPPTFTSQRGTTRIRKINISIDDFL